MGETEDYSRVGALEAHSPTHEKDGADEITVEDLSGVLADQQHIIPAEARAIKLDDFTAPDDNTDLNASITKHGLLKKLSNVVTEFFSGTGAWLVPASGAGLPYNDISGLVLSNDTDADHDINVTAGKARDGSDSEDLVLAAEITKRITVPWSVGNDQGGFDTGSVGNNTLYAVWLIYRSDTEVEDVLFSASFTSPTMPADYDYKRLIGYVITDGSANIIAFTQYGDGREVVIWMKARLQIASGLSSTSYATQALTAVLPASMALLWLPGAIIASSDTWYISHDGTNASIVCTASGSSNAIGQSNELYGAAAASPIFIPFVDGTIWYKVNGSSLTLYVRAALIQR